MTLRLTQPFSRFSPFLLPFHHFSKGILGLAPCVGMSFPGNVIQSSFTPVLGGASECQIGFFADYFTTLIFSSLKILILNNTANVCLGVARNCSLGD